VSFGDLLAWAVC